ncbi:hypothetical protein QVD99_000535 [Batrachochytrium dendrobatidis]|nr:hypothetical protein O5D80_008113 [Batrachochytrium dendrobatidis]KAK5673071.1 hypothetical protein QVD99_000535 [Batrachochytrium dendrobatidis]
MSFWKDIEQREKVKQKMDRSLKEYLKVQNEEAKQRKLINKQNEIMEYKRLAQDQNNSEIQQPYTNHALTSLSHSVIPNISVLGNYNRNPSLSPYSSATGNPLSQRFKNSDIQSSTNQISNVSKYPKNSETNASLIQIANPNSNLKQPFQMNDCAPDQMDPQPNFDLNLLLNQSLLIFSTARIEALEKTVAMDSLTIRDFAEYLLAAEQTAYRTIQKHLSCATVKTKLQSNIDHLDAFQSMQTHKLQESTSQLHATVEYIHQVRDKAEKELQKIHQLIKNTSSSNNKQDILNAMIDKPTQLMMDPHFTALAMKIESLQFQISSVEKNARQSIEKEMHYRLQFEKSCQNLYKDIRDIVHTHERSTANHIETIRQGLFDEIFKERHEQSKFMTETVKCQRIHEDKCKESFATLQDNSIQQQMLMEQSLNDRISDCQAHTVKLRASLADGIKAVRSEIWQSVNDAIQRQKLEETQNQAIQKLSESICLVEKDAKRASTSLEEVLRAEIKSRLEMEKEVLKLKEGIKMAIEDIDKKHSSSLRNLAEGCEEQSKKLFKRIGDIGSRLKHTSSEAHIAEKNTHDILDRKHQLAMLEIKNQHELIIQSELKIQDLTNLCDTIQTKVKKNHASQFTHMDSAKKAIQTQLDTFVKKHDLIQLQKNNSSDIDKLESNIRDIQAFVSEFEKFKCNYATKEDLSEIENKQHLSTIAYDSTVERLQASICSIIGNIQTLATSQEILAMKECISRISNELNTKQFIHTQTPQGYDKYRDLGFELDSTFLATELCTNETTVDTRDSLQQFNTLFTHQVKIHFQHLYLALATIHDLLVNNHNLLNFDKEKLETLQNLLKINAHSTSQPSIHITDQQCIANDIDCLELSADEQAAVSADVLECSGSAVHVKDDSGSFIDDLITPTQATDDHTHTGLNDRKDTSLAH